MTFKLSLAADKCIGKDENGKEVDCPYYREAVVDYDCPIEVCGYTGKTLPDKGKDLGCRWPQGVTLEEVPQEVLFAYDTKCPYCGNDKDYSWSEKKLAQRAEYTISCARCKKHWMVVLDRGPS